MSRELVSIIVPVYNGEATLAACLESIRAQSWEALEVLMVDDGSTDRSREIARRFAEKDARFRALDVPHGGPSSARNAGIRAAKGELLTFVDADDLIEREYIASMVTAMGDSELCLAGYQALSAAQGAAQLVRPQAGRFRLAELGEGITRYEQALSGVAWKLLRRSIVEAHHLAFQPGVSYGEDSLFFFRYLAQIERIAVTDTAQYLYRRHDQGSLLHTAFQDAARIERFLTELETLSREIESETVRYLIAYWQTLNLGVLGLNLCYRTRSFHERRAHFFDVARRCDMKRKCARLRHLPVGLLAVKWAVLTNCFLPLNLLMRAAGRIRHWDRDFTAGGQRDAS